jgi:hypothetical protein
MRGPGPKWHEAHDGSPPPAANDRHGLPHSIWLIPAVTAALVGVAALMALA